MKQKLHYLTLALVPVALMASGMAIYFHR